MEYNTEIVKANLRLKLTRYSQGWNLCVQGSSLFRAFQYYDFNSKWFGIREFKIEEEKSGLAGWRGVEGK